MSPEQILSACEKYRAAIASQSSIRFSLEQETAPFPGQVRSHAKFMCEEIPNIVAQGKIEKAMRWLGFLQAILWLDGKFTLSQLKDDNR